MILPEFLSRELTAQYPPQTVEEIMQGYGAVRPVSFRVNPLRASREQTLRSLSEEGIALESVRWYQDAFVSRDTEQTLKKTRAYRSGAIYLQSLSSMLPPLALGAEAGESVLDMTAAPGGKTTQIAALTAGGALITACEKDGGRFSRLAYNVEKQGAPRVTLLRCDAALLDDFFRFDKILLDAPCSGSGTLRAEERVKITEKTLLGCMKTQTALARKAWRLLKKGGVLVYSTCSILEKENGNVLKGILNNADAEILPLDFPAEIPVFPRSDGAVCVKPSALFEGFFVAKIRKKG